MSSWLLGLALGVTAAGLYGAMIWLPSRGVDPLSAIFMGGVSALAITVVVAQAGDGRREAAGSGKYRFSATGMPTAPPARWPARLPGRTLPGYALSGGAAAPATANPFFQRPLGG